MQKRNFTNDASYRITCMNWCEQTINKKAKVHTIYKNVQTLYPPQIVKQDKY